MEDFFQDVLIYFMFYRYYVNGWLVEKLVFIYKMLN